MPDFPIIDAHFHFYDPGRLAYSWISRLPAMLRKPHGIADYRTATGTIAVERAVFVEFLVDPGLHIQEAVNAQHVVETQTVVGAVVAHVPVENGAIVAADLDRLTALPAVRGIRRILEDGKFEMALEPAFIAGVKTVGAYGLPFEIGVRHWGLTFALELARRCPDVTFILDHLATPGIRHGLREPWWTQIRQFARLPNTLAKMSGVMAGLTSENWRQAEVVPYLAHALDCFGSGRLMFGSDWPMFTPVLTFADWVGIVDTVLAGASADDKRNLFRDTALRVYRLAS